jgi:nucleotide-binding universal stress UspA family protein
MTPYDFAVHHRYSNRRSPCTERLVVIDGWLLTATKTVIHAPQDRSSHRSVMNRIVVGVDGSEGSRRALLWAGREAALHGASLEVIHAYEPAENVEKMGSAARSEHLSSAARQGAQELVDGMSVAIEGVVVQGRAIESLHPAETLVEHSKGADMLVVSSRGRGSFRSLLLGSVSQQCAHHAECPVVIIRAEPENRS